MYTHVHIFLFWNGRLYHGHLPMSVNVEFYSSIFMVPLHPILWMCHNLWSPYWSKVLEFENGIWGLQSLQHKGRNHLELFSILSILVKWVRRLVLWRKSFFSSIKSDPFGNLALTPSACIRHWSGNNYRQYNLVCKLFLRVLYLVID